MMFVCVHFSGNIFLLPGRVFKEFRCVDMKVFSVEGRPTFSRMMGIGGLRERKEGEGRKEERWGGEEERMDEEGDLRL